MKKGSYLFSLLLIVFSSFFLKEYSYSQIFIPNFQDSIISKTSLNIQSEAFYESNHLDNRFTDILIWGGFIDSTLKNQTSNLSNNKNRIGGEWNSSLKFTNTTDSIFKNPNLGYYIQLRNNNIISGGYEKGLFDLIFIGNKQFVDETMQLNTKAKYYSYSTIGGGIINKKLNYEIGISFLWLHGYNELELDNSTLYTHPSGTYLDLSFDYNQNRSDTNQESYFTSKGWGLTIDASYQFKIKDKKHYVSFTDLGFISIGDNIESTTDSNFRFTGFQLDNIFDDTDFSFDNLEDSLNIQDQSKSKTLFAPTLIQIGNIPNYQKKSDLIYGIRYRIISNYIPHIYLGANFRIGQKFSAYGLINYGGYGRGKGALGLRFSASKFTMNLSSSNVFGWITESSFGKSINLQFKTSF